MAIFRGTSRKNKLIGTKSNDLVLAFEGDDTINGRAGDDRIRGGDGNDIIRAGSGNDRLWGDEGNDRLAGGGGNDTLNGGSGDDLLNGGSGTDTAVFAGLFASYTLVVDTATGLLRVTGPSGNDLVTANVEQLQFADITITNPLIDANDAPVTAAQGLSVNEDAVLEITLTATDADVLDEIVHFIITSIPTGGVLYANAVDAASQTNPLATGATIPATANEGTVVFRPDANFNGATSFNVAANDGTIDGASATIDLTVTPINDSPSASDDAHTIDEDTAITFYPLANDSDIDGDTLTITSASVTGGVSVGAVIINADGTLTFTPAGEYSGTAEITYTVSDGNGSTDTATVTITVNAVNDAPVAGDPVLASVTEDGTLPTINLLANTSDVENGTLAVVGGTLVQVSGPTLTTAATVVANELVLDPADPAFQGLAAGETIELIYTYDVTDGDGGTDDSAVIVTVTGTNDQPVVVAHSFTTNEDNAVTFNPLAGATDADLSDTLSIATIALAPANAADGVISGPNLDGTYTFTPAANFSGSVTINYTASDGNGGTDTATVTITVNAVNDAPVAVADSASITEGGSALARTAATGVLANDTDPDAAVDPGVTHTVSAVNGVALNVGTAVLGTYGSATINSNGSWTYTLDGRAEALANGQQVTESFSYTISDGSLTSSAALSITVTGTNDAPVANVDVGTINLATQTSTTINVVANDSDVDQGTILSATLPSNTTTQGGTVSISGNVVTYTPGTGSFFTSLGAGQTAVDSFTYTLSDGAGGTVTGTAHVHVTGENDAPRLDLDTSPDAVADPNYVGADNWPTDSAELDEAAASGDTAGVQVTDTPAITDADAGDRISEMTVNLAAAADSNGTGGSNGYLTFTAAGLAIISGAGLNVSGNPGDSLTISGDATQSQYQALLQQVRYVNDETTFALDTADRVITVQVRDLAGTASNTATATVPVVASVTDVTGLGAVNDFTGTRFDDVINGDDGNDTITGGAGDDGIDGGAGTGDTVDYGRETGGGGVTVNLATSTATDTHGDTDTLTGIENATGTTQVDTLTGGANANTLVGGAGGDTITGGGGADNLQGDAGDDVFLIADAAHHSSGETISGGADADAIRFTASSGTLVVRSGVTGVETVEISDAAGNNSGTATVGINASAVTSGLTIIGNDGINTLTGTGSADVIQGGGEADVLTGGGGDDTLIGGTNAADDSDGDRANYSETLASSAFSYSGGSWTVTTTGAGTDTLTGIEIVGHSGGRFLLVDQNSTNGAFNTIQDAVDAALAGDVILVAPGNYAENVTIATSGITMLSVDGRATTTITGQQAGAELGTIVLAPNVNDVTIGNIDEGFTIIGIDGNGASDKAAIYLDDAHANLTIRGNDIVANGDGGLVHEYNLPVSNVTVDSNIFSGQTFTGANPGGIEFSTQYDLGNNVPRQLVVFSPGSTDVTFTNNEVTGTTGGISSLDGVTPQGNNLVTIDSANAVISNNLFTGYTIQNTPTTFVHSLRVGGANATVTDNVIDNSVLGSESNGITLRNSATGGTFTGNEFIGDSDSDVVFSRGNTPANAMTPGADTVNGNSGDDVLAAGAGDDTINGGAGNDRLYGQGGADTLLGGADNDTIYSGAGDDVSIDGGTGDDTIYVYRGEGADQALGGDGDDTVVVKNATFAFTGDTLLGGPGIVFTIGSVASTIGDATDDVLIQMGTVASDASFGSVLVDQVEDISIVMGSGGDTVFVATPLGGTSLSTSTITVTGGSGNDTVDAGEIDNSLAVGVTFTGGGGDDTFVAGDGGDTFHGDGGTDTIDYSGADAGVALALGEAGSDATATGGGAGDTIRDVENVTGSAFDDTITGNSADNVIATGSGSDDISGGGGTDRVIVTGSAADFTVAVDGLTGKLTLTGTGPLLGTVIEIGGDTAQDVEELAFSAAPGTVYDLTNPVTLLDAANNLVQTYDTIQDAVAAASAGYTVLVAAGTYAGDITLPVSITILGANAGTAGTGVRNPEVILTGTVTVTAGAGESVTLSGLEFQNSSDNSTSFKSLVVMSGADLTVTDNVFYSTGANGNNSGTPDRAIELQAAATGDIEISTNLFSGAQTGATNKYATANWTSAIWSDGGGSPLLISENTFSNVRSALNLDSYDDATHTVTGNTFSSSGTGIAIGIPDTSTYAGINNNTFSDVDTDFHMSNVSAQAVVLDLEASNNTSVAAGADTVGTTTVLGGSLGDTITGTTGADVLVGNAGGDTLTGGGGDDLIVSAGGNDVANFASTELTSASFALVADALPTAGVQPGWSVTATSGGEGTDTLHDVEIVVDQNGSRFLLVGNGGFDTIQAAVDAAQTGDTILIAAGTYEEQVDISGLTDVTLQSVGGTVTIAAPTTITDFGISDDRGATRPIYYVVAIDGSTGVKLSGITVDGDFMGDRMPVGFDGDDDYAGILVTNSTGTVLDDVTVIDVRMTDIAASGMGHGVYVDNTGVAAATITITGSTFSGFEKDAINARLTDVDISGGTITGLGVTSQSNGINPDPAQNGIQLIDVTGSVDGVTITDIAYDNPAVTHAAGILVFGNSQDLAVTNNTLTGALLAGNVAGFLGLFFGDGTGGTVTGNTITNADYGIYGQGAFAELNGTWSVGPNTFSNIQTTGVFWDPTADGTGDGVQTVQGSGVEDDISGAGLGDTLSGLGGDDVIRGRGGSDTIHGGNGADTITGGLGADTLFGDAGDDLFVWAIGDGNDTIDGGNGPETLGDLVNVDADGTANTVTVAAATIAVGAETIGYSAIEHIDIDTLGGDDTIAVNQLTGATVNVDGGSASSVTLGIGGSGQFTSATGGDTLSFAGAGAGVTANLTTNTFTQTGSGIVHVEADVENVIGSAVADNITGDGGANIIEGGDGGDILSGLAGTDVIRGGAGADQIFGGTESDHLFGGSGSDTINMAEGADFAYFLAVDNLAGGDFDTLLDFSVSGGDKIVIDGGAGIFSNLAPGTFGVISSDIGGGGSYGGFTPSQATLIFDSTGGGSNSIWYDNAGDGVADFKLVEFNVGSNLSGLDLHTFIII